MVGEKFKCPVQYCSHIYSVVANTDFRIHTFRVAFLFTLRERQTSHITLSFLPYPFISHFLWVGSNISRISQNKNQFF